MTQETRRSVIRVTDLCKIYHLGGESVAALAGVSLEIFEGEFVAVMGPSGSGKSTFMNVVGCLDKPTSGSYQLGGQEVASLSPSQLADVRNRELGFIFQGFNLLPRMDALANVMLPMLYAGAPSAVRRMRAEAALHAVGLGSRIHHRPKELSGGQQQRVAIARSLVNKPTVILADEPTGNLDSHTTVEIMGILQRLNDRGATIVMVTHEPELAEYLSRVVTFRDGKVVSDEQVKHRRSAEADLAALAPEIREAVA